MDNIFKRNGRLDLMKFLAAIVVMSVHFRWNPVFFQYGNHKIALGQSGPLSVIFFFMVSGAMFSMSNFRKKDAWKKGIDAIAIDTKNFLTTKYLQLVKWYLIALALYIVNDVFFGAGIKKALEKLFYTIPSILLLGRTGFDNQEVYQGGYYVGASWYLSAMMLLFLLTYPLIRANYNLFTKVLSPIIIVASLYINLNLLFDHLVSSKFYAIIPFLIGVMIGDQICCLNDKHFEFIKKHIWPVRIIELMCYLLSFLYICIDTTEMLYSDYPIIFITAFGIFLTIANRISPKTWDNKICFALGDISRVLFMIHIPILLTVENLFKVVNISPAKNIYLPIVEIIAIIVSYFAVNFDKKITAKKKV